ncbi:MAG: heavy metal translocating P-type ATPase [Citrobacter freundii]|nr:MAG: heavy metal translocating P-type ATPase [Citrobacter freundii]
MSSVKVNLDLVLLGIPECKNGCTDRLIEGLGDIAGIKKVQLLSADASRKAQLYIQYDKELISASEVLRLSKGLGAKITDRYRQIIVEVIGIRHQRQTRLIDSLLQDVTGILSVSTSVTGAVQVEFDSRFMDEDHLFMLLEKQGLKVLNRNCSSKTKIVTLKTTTGKNESEKASSSGQHAKKDHAEEGGHGGVFGKNTELIFSLTCGLLIGIGYALEKWTNVSSTVPVIFFIGAFFFGGFFTAREAVQTIAKGGFEIDFLMLVAAVGAAILDKWAEGALLLFLFSLGHALEHFAMEKARKSIAALTDLAPKTALLKTGSGTKEVRIEELRKGDLIVVRPNTKISADGVVIKGNSSVNQAPITGESIPVDKEPVDNPDINAEDVSKLDAKFRVFAGTINGNELLEIKVTKEASDSTLSRLVKLVNEAQTQKSPTQQFTDRFEKIFVPVVLILVVALCFAFLVIDEPFSASFYRAMSVLVAASPCALAISTPSAVLSGVARAARAGVLIKGGRPLEDLGTLTALAFDKTGTLTEGKPKLTKVVPLSDSLSEVDLLKIVVAVEDLSDHPIAKAIVRDGKAKLGDQTFESAHDLEAVLGKGIKAKLGSDEIFAGNLALFESLDDAKPSNDIIENVRKTEGEGNTTMLIRRNRDYIGLIAVMDTPRPEAKETLELLKKEGIKKMIMLTGDNQQVADAIAKQTGLTEAWGGLLPEQKVESIQKLAKDENKVAMVGDGVNDAPAMAKSTVGIAMGAAGSDVALETADIALMGDKLILLPFAIGLSRKSKRIIKQNLVISLGVVAVLVPLTILGVTTIGPAVIAHEGSTLIVVFNALRLLAYKSNVGHAEQKSKD